MFSEKTIIANLLFLFTFFLTFSSSLHASENAKVEGFVTDAVTGDFLPGANVFLSGTGIGSSTDLDGYFNIIEIPPGSYILRTTYIGYKQLDVTIEVKAGDVITKNFKLSPEALEGETLVITAQAEGQMAAINQQLSAKSIVNVVSSVQIQELPDANAAESLRRLPGVSITRVGGEGSQVVIRGLAPKFNIITIDGIRIASSNADNRSADLSMISPNMLDGIEVSKTITADQDADVIGGTVNFKLRKAKPIQQGLGIHLLAQGGYTGLSNAYNKYNNYKLVPSIERRFIDNRLGVFIQANLERRNLTSNEFGAVYTNKSADQINYITQSINLNYIYRDRQRNNGTLALDYKLPHANIRLTNFINSSVTEVENRYETFDINAGAGARNQHVYSLEHSKSTLNMISNALIIEGQLPIFHADLKLSHDYSETKNPDDWNVTFRQSPAGIGQFENVENLNPKTVLDSVLTDPDKTKLNTITTNNNHAEERTLMASLDLDMPLNLSKMITSVIKFGGKYRTQKRSYTSEVYGTNATFISPSAQGASRMIIDHFGIPTNDPTAIPLSFFVDENFTYGKFLDGDYELHNPMNFGVVEEVVRFSQDNVDAFKRAGSAEAFARNNYLSNTNNYSGDEILTAGYAMAIVNIGPKLRIIPGIRYQNLQTTYSGIRGQQSAISYYNYDHTDTTFTVNHPYWLPNVNIWYKPFLWFDVRLAYSTTLSYPDFNAIIPRIDVTTGADLEWNDYTLKPSRSKNYDAYFTFSENSIGLLTVGGFLKKIDNLIYPWTFSKAGLEAKPYYLTDRDPASHLTYKISTFINNPFVVDDYGLEFDWQTHFWYLPDPLKGLVLNVNYTRVFSEAEYPYVYAGATSATDIDTSFTDRLIHQPNHIVNLTLGYDYKDFSIRVSLLYQDDVFTGVSQWPQLRSNTADYKRWDITAKQGLPWLGLQLYAWLNNLNDAKDLNVLNMYPDTPKTLEAYGMSAEIGLRLQL
jgi:TonB-dependent receptor